MSTPATDWANGQGVAGELLVLAERVVASAKPGEQVEVVVGRSRRTVVRAYGGEVESLTSAETAGLGVRVIVGGRQGLARAGSFAEDVVAETLAGARDNVAFAQPDPFAGLAEPDAVAPAALELWAPEVASIDSRERVGRALELERLVLAADPRINGVRQASHGDGMSAWAIASTAGIRAATAATSSSAGVIALAAEGHETQVGAASAVGRHPRELDFQTVAREAADRATRLLGARPVPTRRMSVVLDPRVTVAVLGIAAGMLSGERVLKGRSPFAERLGGPIASEGLTLVDDATDPASAAADPYDGEGLATRPNPLVEDGVLRTFLHNAYTARRAGTVSTGSAVRGYGSAPGVGALALRVRPGPATPEELLAEVGDGILVWSVNGLHSGVNAVSGDFSVGVEGACIRGGEPAEPVREVTLASTVPRMLLDIVALGSDLTWVPGGDAAPTVVIADVTISGR